MNKLSIRDIGIKDKVIIMRADFNVPLDGKLNITDDIRIKATLPTIKYILENGAKKLILISHLGRPKGKFAAEFSLNPVAERLKVLLGLPVKFLNDCVGEGVKKNLGSAKEKIILLENLRFHPEEEKNDPGFAKQLASLAEIYVNDAFGTAHRAHASTEGITHDLKAVAGLLLEKEIQYLGGAILNPEKPFMVILGGAKVSDKIGIIDNLLPKSEVIIIGGGMAYTFLKAQDKQIGASKLEPDKIKLAKGLLDKAKQIGKEIVLPIDHLVVEKIDPQAKSEVVRDNIPEAKIAVDIGPDTVALFKEKLRPAKTLVWNGPLGIFEIEAFSQGTKEIAEFIAAMPVTSIIGGGDTAAAVAKFKLENRMTHISTGGGASLEYLEGKALPGVAALADK